MKMAFTTAILMALGTFATADAAVRSEVPKFIGHPDLDSVQPQATLEGKQLRLENGYLTLTIKLADQAPLEAEIVNHADERTYHVRLVDPMLKTEQGNTIERFQIGGTSVDKLDDAVMVNFKLHGDGVNAVETLRLGRGDHWFTSALAITNDGPGDLILEEVWPERIGLDSDELNVEVTGSQADLGGANRLDQLDLGKNTVHKSNLTDIVSYLVGAEGDGLFATLDFLYCQLRPVENNRLAIGYPPRARLAPGARHEAHPAVIGVFTRRRDDLPADSGPEYAFLRWITRTCPPQLDYPQIHFYHINCDFYDPRTQGYYTYRDPEMGSYMRNLEGTNLMLRFLGGLGFNSYQAMEEPFAFREDEIPDPREWEETVELAQDNSIRFGAGPISPKRTILSYNNPLKKPVKEDLLKNDAAVAWFEDELVRYAEKYGFRMYNWDVLGVDGEVEPHRVYQQIRNVASVLENVERRVPGMAWDSNLGFKPLQPKIVKYVDGIYPDDPYGVTDYITLNRNLNLDESRRRVYTRAMSVTGLPPTSYRQCQYYLADNSLVRNLKTFQYQLLMCLATGPNFGTGHLYNELQEMPRRDSELAEQFFKRWIKWDKKNYDLLKRTRYLGEGSAGGHIYAHVEGDRGYLFLVNPNYWTTSARISLNHSIGLIEGQEYRLTELHPEERVLVAGRLPWPRWGDEVTLNVEPVTVRVIEIEPAQPHSEPLLFGLEGNVERIEDGTYRVTATGWQGRELPFAILAPQGEKVDSLRAVDPPKVDRLTEEYNKQPPGEIVHYKLDGTVVSGRLRLPRVEAQTELREWTIQPESLDHGLKSGLEKGNWTGLKVRFSGNAQDDGASGGFAGAYVENVFQEQRELFLKLKTSPAASPAIAEITAEASELQTAPADKRKSDGGSAWYSVRLPIPFVGLHELQPDINRHLYMPLILHRPEEIEKPRVWINGEEALVERFEYGRADYAGCWYVDGTNEGFQSGDNTVVVYLEQK